MTEENKITQRWRKPVKPMAVSDAPTVITTALGRETQEIHTRFRPEDIGRMKAGYVCINCWEPHEQPYPDECSVCRYPMKARQAADFEQAFKGKQRDPRAERLEQGLDRVDDQHERNFYVTKSGIVVPASIRQ